MKAFLSNYKNNLKQTDEFKMKDFCLIYAC